MQTFDEGDTPSAVYDKVLENAQRGFRGFIEPEGKLAINKLRLVGLYDDRQYGYFMLRTRIAGGHLTSPQAKVIGEVAEQFSRRPQGNTEDEERFIEITTRQDIQIHWLSIDDIPEIWKRYSEVKLTSLEACGNTTRNVTSCPVSGLDPDGAFDASPIVDSVNGWLLANPSVSSFLPRKFKISISGCREDCTLARINDLSFTPAKKDGRLGFHVWVGGGLSDYPRMASRINGFVERGQVLDLIKACLKVYMEFGDYAHPAINRFRALVDSMGPENVTVEIQRRMPFTLEPLGEDLVDLGRGLWNDHVGVRRQKQDGSSYVGLNVLVGRMVGRDLIRLAGLADEYGSGELRLTQRQNVIITNVRGEGVGSLLKEPLLEKLKPAPKPFERGFVACTGAPFCKFGLANSKEAARRIQAYLDDAFVGRYAGSAPLRVHLSACTASCAQPQIADIGLRATTSMSQSESDLEEAFDLGVGGNLSKGRLIKWVRFAVPARSINKVVARLVDGYLISSEAGRTAVPVSTFSDYLDALTGEELKELIYYE